MHGVEVEAVKALRTHPECNVSAIAKKYDVAKSILENGISSLTSFLTHNNDTLYRKGQKKIPH